MIHDPIEYDPTIRPLIEAASKEADAELIDHPHRGHPGFCYVFWETQKRILRDRYGIEWKDPAEMNPHIMFD